MRKGGCTDGPVGHPLYIGVSLCGVWALVCTLKADYDSDTPTLINQRMPGFLYTLIARATAQFSVQRSFFWLKSLFKKIANEVISQRTVTITIFAINATHRLFLKPRPATVPVSCSNGASLSSSDRRWTPKFNLHGRILWPVDKVEAFEDWEFSLVMVWFSWWGGLLRFGAELVLLLIVVDIALTRGSPWSALNFLMDKIAKRGSGGLRGDIGGLASAAMSALSAFISSFFSFGFFVSGICSTLSGSIGCYIHNEEERGWGREREREEKGKGGRGKGRERMSKGWQMRKVEDREEGNKGMMIDGKKHRLL